MRLAFVFLFHLFLLCPASSKDLGVFGETFEISEKDLLEQIFSRLKVLQETGKLEAEQKKIRERVKEMVFHPQAVTGITPTKVRREYQFDPTITVTRDLTDHRGQIFAKKGDRFNPLDRISFSKPLLFIDGDDEKQIKWAIFKIKENPFSKLILVKGSPLDLQKRLTDVENTACPAQAKQLQQMPALQALYFDQHGVLTTKLGIKHVPAIVFQKKTADGSNKNVLTIIEETGGEDE